jgi:hypothetical protein
VLEQDPRSSQSHKAGTGGRPADRGGHTEVSKVEAKVHHLRDNSSDTVLTKLTRVEKVTWRVEGKGVRQ